MNERKRSEVSGTGIQYIPGHIEPFIDLVLNEYLPSHGGILDLGGGGLRFGIPVAAKKRKITVVDLDSTGLNIDLIVNRMASNRPGITTDLDAIKNNLTLVSGNIFQFLANTSQSFSLITAFRLIHFFNAHETEEFFEQVSSRLDSKGILAVSAITPYTEDNVTFNELYENSVPVDHNPHLRRFCNNEIANNIRKEQNLGKTLHLFADKYLSHFAELHGFEILRSNLPSTRIVRGFLLEKRRY